MNATPRLPNEATRWLKAVDARIATVDPAQRREIVDGFRSHIQESIDSGDDIDGVLASLGDPNDVADAALQDQPSTPTRYLTVKRVLQIIALALAAAAVVALCALPGYVSVTTDSRGHESIQTQGVLAVMGLPYLAVLMIPVVLAAIPLLLRGRAWQPASITVAILIAAFGILGALSIGFYYLPAVIVSIVAAIVPARPRTTVPKPMRIR